MPFRKQIAQIIRRISGMPTVDTHVQAPVEHQPPVRPVERPITPLENATKTSTTITPNLVLHGRPSCPYCARVDRVIENWISRINDASTYHLRVQWRDDLRNRTGSTQVPRLFIDGEAMFESLDIIA